MRDGFGAMWYSKGEGVNAWLQVIFKNLFIITKFEVRMRKNPNERNKILELEFSNGEKQRFTMFNNDETQTFSVNHVQTSYIIVKVIEVYGTINNGGAFNFWGIECKNLEVANEDSKEANGLLKAAGVSPKKIPALFKVETEEIFGVGCRENLINSKKFRTTKMAFGEHITIQCFTSCALTPYFIYGTDRYTKDSSLCKAAFHARKIEPQGGKVIYSFITFIGESFLLKRS